MTVRPGEDVEEQQQLHGTENGEHYDDGSGRDHEAGIAVDAAAASPLSQISSESLPHVKDIDDDDDHHLYPPKSAIPPSPDADDVEARHSLSSNLHSDERAELETREDPPNETPQINPETTDIAHTSQENKDSAPAPAPTPCSVLLSLSLSL